MTTDELKAKVEKYRSSLNEKAGKSVVFSANGPANMGLIDALVKAVESLERRVENLEAEQENNRFA